jgi:RND superfamily putative drug exporter
LGGLAARRPRTLVAAAILLALLGAALGGTVTGRLTSGGERDPASPSVRAERQLEQAMGGDPDASLLVLVRPAERAPLVAERLRELGLRGVVAPRHGKPRLLLARDGRSALVVAPEVSRAKVAAVARALEGEPGVALGGGPVVSSQVESILSADLKRAELIALPLVFLLSFWVFRGLVAALLPPLVGFVTIAGALLGLRLASEVTALSVYALNLITGLGLGLAIDWSLFVVSRYREELARLGPGAEALRETVRTAGKTVLYSALTVAAALSSLLVFPQRFLFSMGLGGMVVALTGAAVALILLPAALALLGPRVNSLAPRRLQRQSEQEARSVAAGFWYRLSRLVMRRPLPIAAATAALLLVLGAPFGSIKLTGFSPAALPVGASGRLVEEALRSQFSPQLSPAAYAVVTAPASARRDVDAFARRLRQLPERPEVAPPRRVGGDTWRIDVSPRSPDASAGERLVAAIRSLPSRFPVLVGGASASLVDQKASLLSNLPVALGVLVGGTLVLLLVMTRSLVLPLKAIILNLLTIAAALGVLVWVFQDGRLQDLLDYTSVGGIEATHLVLIATVAFGLSTDYGIFLLGRIKEARDRGADTKTAVAHGLERSGRVVSAAALLFIVAIGATAASRLVSVKEVGLATALAVLIDATVVRALLVPSLMCLLGRWNWWLPRLAPVRVKR